jgi:hypothetical protein
VAGRVELAEHANAAQSGVFCNQQRSQIYSLSSVIIVKGIVFLSSVLFKQGTNLHGMGGKFPN